MPVVLAGGVHVLDEGRLVVGGWPFGLLRLTDAGAEVLAGWTRGAPVGEAPVQRALARRLLDQEILRPRPSPVASASSLTVVVPVRDRPVELARCLEGIRATCPESAVIVVDDGSADPGAARRVCAERAAAVIHLGRSRGPAAARNTALTRCGTPYVAFVDSDVVVRGDWAHRLLAHFADPCVGAVAPRVRALRPSDGPIARYEQRHSPLDMGMRAGCVGPGRPTSYVPGAVLLVRRSAVDGGFDEALEIGEDVDLVWRLAASGWRVRYAPEADVWHDHRTRLRSFASRRRAYARSIAILSRRHPGALPAARMSPTLSLPWSLGLAGHPAVALCAAAVDVELLRRKLEGLPRRPYRTALSLVARGLLDTGLGLAHAGRRAWAPILLLGHRRRGTRWALIAAFTAAVVQDAFATREWRAVASDTPIRLLDEVIALGGTWEGCVRERTIRPLLPSWRTHGRR